MILGDSTMYNVTVTRKSEKELLIIVHGEDHTIGNMIVKEALKHPNVTYAAYRIPHPLQDRLEIYLSVKEGCDPVAVFKEVCGNLRRYLLEFKKEVEEKIIET